MTTWGQEGGSLKSHLFIQIYRVLWGTWGTPLHPLCPRERGKSRPSLPLGDPWGTGGCPWRSVGEVRRAPPQRASPAPQAVTGPRALGSVWKAELRELEGRAVAWVCSWGGRGPALPLRTAWVRLALWLPSDGGGGGGHHRGIWGSSQHSSHPVQEGGAEGLGVQRQSLAPSGVLEKLIPKDTRPWLRCPQKAAKKPGVGMEHRGNSRRPSWRVIPEEGTPPGWVLGASHLGKGPLAPPGLRQAERGRASGPPD